MKYELRLIGYKYIDCPMEEIDYDFVIGQGIIEHEADELSGILGWMTLTINCDQIDTENNYLVIIDKEEGIILYK